MTPNVRDLILGCFLLGLGVALQVYIIPEGVVVPGSVKSIALSPDLWPRVVAGLFILLGGIIQARQYADYFGAAVIICVPDDMFPEIPARVKNFAGEQGIRLRPLAELGNALKDLLG